jgi:predicted ATPase
LARKSIFWKGGKPTSVGGKGEYTQEILWLDKRIGHENLTKKVNDWLERLKFDIQLEIDRIKGDMYQLKIVQNGLSINAADVGFGISQILPILTECLDYSTKESSRNLSHNFFYGNYMLHRTLKNGRKMIICQQPEIHLNPRIQSELGDFFTQLDDPKLSLLIETHSEHIITRLQRRVADGTLDPKDIEIYFVSKENNSSKIKYLSISKRGEFDHWPEGFFQDDYIDTMEILKASLKQPGGE